MLLAVAEVATVSNDAHAQQIIAVGHVESELHSSGATCFGGEAFFLLLDNLIRQRIEERQRGGAFHLGLRQVVNGRSDARLVSHPHEARQVRRQHKLLAGGGGGFQVSNQHILGVGVAAEIPAGEALRRGEGEDQFARFVGAQLRVEESGFGEVRAQAFHRLESFGGSFGSCTVFGHCGFLQLGQRSDLHHSLIPRHGSRYGGLLGAGKDTVAGSDIGHADFVCRNYLVEVRYIVQVGIAPVEVVVHPLRHLPILRLEVRRGNGHPPRSSPPIMIRYVTAEVDGQRLMAAEELVERSIVHRSQHLGSSGKSLRSLHHQLPFFLLAGAQMVAEDFPLHIERAGRFALRQSHCLVIVLSVLHHVEGNGDAFAVGLLVGIL